LVAESSSARAGGTQMSIHARGGSLQVSSMMKSRSGRA
jgi:hypothetical protein